MNYILFTGEHENREVFALVQGPEQVDWDKLYRQFAQEEGLPYKVYGGSDVDISPGGTSRRFFETDTDAGNFLNWLTAKGGFKKLAFKEHTL